VADLFPPEPVEISACRIKLQPILGGNGIYYKRQHVLYSLGVRATFLNIKKRNKNYVE